MSKTISVHEGVVRHGLVAELELFRAPGRRVSSYYLNLKSNRPGDTKAARIALKDTLQWERQRIDQLDVSHSERQALIGDWEMVSEVAPIVVGERSTLSVACFVSSDDECAQVIRLPWPVRDRAFFEDRFVVWPLRQVLDQSDRYGIVLADKDDSRLFLFFLEQIEEESSVKDEIPGRIRFPDPYGELEYMRKHVESVLHHFENAAEQALRLYQREPFEHLIIGGLWETLPQFEPHLHRYLRDRIVARWDIDLQHTPTPQIRERARDEEQQLLRRKAQEVHKAIQDQRTQRGAVGLDEVFPALWKRRVETLLVGPDARRQGFRCSTCGRLTLNDAPCVECGGKTAEVPNLYEGAVQDAIEQAAQVRYWNDPALHEVQSIEAFKRF